MARPRLEISRALGTSPGPDLRPRGRPSSLQTTADYDASSKPHHDRAPLLIKAIIVADVKLLGH